MFCFEGGVSNTISTLLGEQGIVLFLVAGAFWRENRLGVVLTAAPTFAGANWISIQHQQHSKKHDQFGSSVAQGSTLDNNQEQLTLQPDKMIRSLNKTTACMLISMLIPCFTHPGAKPTAWKFPCCRHTAPMLLMAFPALKAPNKRAETEDVQISKPLGR